MEVITGLVLILLGTAGARNIPVHMDASSELQLQFDLSRNTKTSLEPIFPDGVLAESVVNVQDLGLYLNKNTDEDEIVEDHVNNVGLATDVKENTDTYEKSNDKKQEGTDNVLIPVEAIEVQNNEKTEDQFFEERTSF